LAGDAVVVDAPGTAPGRGAYVCGDACLQRAIAARALPRAFRRPVGPMGDTLESVHPR
jgi:predicted RNA-binding protein YlxR (DUF448 family)